MVVLISVLIPAILPNYSSCFRMPGAWQESPDCHSTSYHYVNYLEWVLFWGCLHYPVLIILSMLIIPQGRVAFGKLPNRLFG